MIKADRLRRLVTSLLLAAMIVAPYAAPLSAYADEGDGSADTSSAPAESNDSGESDTSSASSDSDNNDSSDAGDSPAADPAPTDETEASDSTPQDHTEAETDAATENDVPNENQAAAESAPSSGGSNGGSSDTSTNVEAEASSTTTTTIEQGPFEKTTTNPVASSSTSTQPIVIPPTDPLADPQPTIVSGRAVALANVLNIVNTNFVNSEGAMVFSNFVDPVEGSIDFRTNLPFLQGGACGLMPCFGGDQVSVSVNNDAHIRNALVLTANTGGNDVEGGDVGSIATGDAYAGLNLINLANTNIIDSNYLLVTMNAFQGIRGDVVFPSFASFFSPFMRSGSDSTAIDTTNAADIENIITIDADTGDNTVTGADTSSIATGDARGSASVFSQINANMLGTANFSILFRVHGAWAGQIFGAPGDLGWTRTADGSILLFDTAQGGRERSMQSIAITGENDASIHNDVSVIALTGENAVTDSSTALIQTGDAYAGANIVNIANTNIIGRNWVLAIVNIFGDFDGNIAFGRPDLWVGEQVSVPSSIQNGSELEYKFSVINNGDSESSETVLSEQFDTAHVEILASSLPFDASTPGVLTWDLGTIPAGQATEVSYRARVKDAAEGTAIVNVVQVNGRETDNNSEDNTDTATIVTARSSEQRFKAPLPRVTEEPAQGISLNIERSEAEISVQDGVRTIHQEIVIRNDTATEARQVVIHDLLRTPEGVVLQDEVWDLGNVLPKEEITLGYDIIFANDAPVGTYRLSTAVEGANVERSEVTNGSITFERTIAAPEESDTGDVLGISFSNILGAETAHASDGEDSAANHDSSPWWQFFFVGALLSVAYVLMRRINSYAR